jgi:hypothetical protein
VGGVCQPSCGAALVVCPSSVGLVCADLQTDRNHCGTCATACGPGKSCVAGACVASCGAPLTACSTTNTCADTAHDPANCGGCGKTCPAAPNADPACSAGACAYACHSGYADCNAVAADGCEAHLADDPANCGRCANACAPGAACMMGVCGVTAPESVLVVYVTPGAPPQVSLDVQSHLQATGAFVKVDLFDASTTPPTVAQLQQYTCVLAFSFGPIPNPGVMGDTLAAYLIGGGRVVLAGLALDSMVGVSGLFTSGGYMLATSTGLHQPANPTVQVLEPGSPLLDGYTNLTAASPYVFNMQLKPGTQVAAAWSTGEPLIIHGTVNGHNRVDLNMIPTSGTVLIGGWLGDGGILMKDALLFR